MEKSRPKCDFCNKDFSSEGSLKTHLATAKYCLINRPTTKIVKNIKTCFICEYCEKSFTQKIHLQTHESNCRSAAVVIKNQQIINQLKIDHKLIVDKMIIEQQNFIKIQCQLKQQITDLSVGHQEIVYKLKQDASKMMRELVNESEDNISKLIIKLEETERKLEQKKNKLQNLKESNQNTVIELAHNKGQIVGIKTAPPVSTSTQTINAKEVNIKNKLANVPTNNIRPLSVEYIREKQDNYNYEMFLLGADGIAQFFEPLMICYNENDPNSEPSRNYVCTDASRNKYHKLLDSRKWQVDDGVTVLGEWINGLDDISDSHWDQYNEDAENLPVEIERHNLAMKRGAVLATFNGIKISHGVERNKLVSDVRAKLKNKICI